MLYLGHGERGEATAEPLPAWATNEKTRRDAYDAYCKINKTIIY